MVLHFYPRDNTPGCTREGQAFRDHHAEFEELGAIILGVSRDSVRTHENFRAKNRFPFDLLSDSDETVCNLYGVIKEKNMYGRRVMGIERSTFLIGRDDGILHRIPFPGTWCVPADGGAGGAGPAQARSI